MLNIRVFSLEESDLANAFIKNARVIKDGIKYVDGKIVIEHDVLEEFNEEAQKDMLKTQLEKAKLQLWDAEIGKEFYSLMEQGGRMDTESLQKQAQNNGAIEGAKAQIYILSKRLGLDTKGMQVFGKKQYEDNDTNNPA